jgi:hypothetical protein
MWGRLPRVVARQRGSNAVCGSTGMPRSRLHEVLTEQRWAASNYLQPSIQWGWQAGKRVFTSELGLLLTGRATGSEREIH